MCSAKVTELKASFLFSGPRVTCLKGKTPDGAFENSPVNVIHGVTAWHCASFHAIGTAQT